ncbi:MAG: fluoride efflux transporter CrcB [Rhodothermales bacterium]|nr:fluoride efflux transporter CrcB [Rhodothermales bacterium]
MQALLMVMLGGALGAATRYGAALLAERFSDAALPLATWGVNFTGCLLIGLLVPLLGRGGLPDALQYLLVVGFLGALTTFSTFSLETLVLWEGGLPWYALLNAAGSVVIGLLCVWLGLQLGRLLA